ncbi:piggyBac transposable element-derived protein 3-like [Vespula maculifrons]|uniref:PiggyBac transposable element-derived protein 3-like n=1 Tax=Vespula maculifrons TaxID=7453 RepID=A0ABD2B8V5_VESMC
MATYIIPILVKITEFYNIPTECSDIENDEFYNCENKQEENEIELFNNKNNNNKIFFLYNNIFFLYNVQKSSESEFENILNLRKEKRLARVLSSSEDENENQMGLFLQFTKIEKSNKCLTETVEFYNKTKFSVDIADQMTKKYNVKSRSRR